MGKDAKTTLILRDMHIGMNSRVQYLKKRKKRAFTISKRAICVIREVRWKLSIYRDFQLRVESNPRFHWFALLRSVIGPKNAHCQLNQSDVKLKPITTRSPAFSRASGGLLVYILSFHWLLKVFFFLLIGHRDFISIGKRSSMI